MIPESQQKIVSLLSMATNEMKRHKEIDKEVLEKIIDFKQELETMILQQQGIYDDFVDDYDYDIEDWHIDNEQESNAT